MVIPSQKEDRAPQLDFSIPMLQTETTQTPLTPETPSPSQSPTRSSSNSPSSKFTLEPLSQLDKISTLPYYKPNPNAVVRVFAFHGSGGNALSYNRWSGNDKIEICAIEIPGHGTRKSEPIYTSLHELVKKIGEELASNIKPTDCIVYIGFSFGAFLAYEVSCYLKKYHHIDCYHFFPISRAPPHWFWMDDELRENIQQNWSDYDIVEYMANTWNLPRLNKILSFSEPDRTQMSESVAKLHRADMLMGGENIDHAEDMNCPITAIYGFDDTAYPQYQVEMWKDYSHNFEIFGVKSNHENTLNTKDANNIVINTLMRRLQEDFPNM